jgi:hypothetical protein
MTKKQRNRIEEYTKSGLREVEKVAAMVGTFDWRMDDNQNILDWYLQWSQPFGLKIGRKIAAICQLHAGLDPEMARFLSDTMATLEEVKVIQEDRTPNGWLEREEFDDVVERFFVKYKWIDDIYAAFRHRIQCFFDKITRRWDHSVDPLSLEPVWQVHPQAKESNQRPRYPGITVGLTEHAKNCRFNLIDAGKSELNLTLASGITAFALWRSGVPNAALEAFGIEMADWYADTASILCNWVNLDGNGGSDLSRLTVLKLCHPNGLPVREPERAKPIISKPKKTKARQHVNDEEIIAALSSIPDMVRLYVEKKERIEGIGIDPNGAIALVIDRYFKTRYVPIPVSVASHIICQLRDGMEYTPHSLGTLDGFICVADMPEYRLRLHYEESGLATYVGAIFIIGSPPLGLDSDNQLDENVQTDTPNDHDDGTSPDYPMMALKEREIFISNLSQSTKIAAVESLLQSGYMKEAPEDDGGYGRRRFIATYAGMRRLSKQRAKEGSMEHQPSPVP